MSEIEWKIEDGELRRCLDGVWTCVNAEEAADIVLELMDALYEARSFLAKDVDACVLADDVVARIDRAIRARGEG